VLNTLKKRAKASSLFFIGYFLHSLFPHEKLPPTLWALFKHCRGRPLLHPLPASSYPCIAVPGINYSILLVGIISQIFHSKHWPRCCPWTALNPRTNCSCCIFTGYFSSLCASSYLPVELKKKTHTHEKGGTTVRAASAARWSQPDVSHPF